MINIMIKNNIVLIGMPGAGKSTVGVVLAKTLGYDFVDTDILLSRQIGMTLQTYINAHGIEAFLKEEERAALSLDCSSTVIATGGSMVLSEVAMSKLRTDSTVAFIDVPIKELVRRLKNISTRGIALKQGQTIEDLYQQRLPLYIKYADITVPEQAGKTRDLESIVAAIIARLKGR